VIGELKAVVDETLACRKTQTFWQPVTLAFLIAHYEKNVWPSHLTDNSSSKRKKVWMWSP